MSKKDEALLQSPSGSMMPHPRWLSMGSRGHPLHSLVSSFISVAQISNKNYFLGGAIQT